MFVCFFVLQAKVAQAIVRLHRAIHPLARAIAQHHRAICRRAQATVLRRQATHQLAQVTAQLVQQQATKNIRNDQKRAEKIFEREMANLNTQTPEKSPFVKVPRKIYTFMEDMYRKLVCLLLV